MPLVGDSGARAAGGPHMGADFVDTRAPAVEQLAHRLTKENPKALGAISDAAMAIASALAAAATVTAADAAKTAAATAASELNDLHGWINLQRGSASDTPRTA